MDPEKKRRAWFQIHLSTALVMMLVASALLYFNILITQSFSPSGYSSMRAGFPDTYFWYAAPKAYNSYRFVPGQTVLGSSFRDLQPLEGSDPPTYMPEYENWEYSRLGVNVGWAAFTLALCALILEGIIRGARRAREADPPRKLPLHVSTILALSLSVGLLCVLNLRNQPVSYESVNPFLETKEVVTIIKKGWPFSYKTEDGWRSNLKYIPRREIVFNVLSCLAMITALAIVLEWRHARKEDAVESARLSHADTDPYSD